MTKTESNPALDIVLMRLSRNSQQLDTMKEECKTPAGAWKTAEWLMSHEPELLGELSSAEALAGYLLHVARQGAIA